MPSTGLGLDEPDGHRQTRSTISTRGPGPQVGNCYTVAGCQAERTVIEADGRRAITIAVESTDPADVMAAIDVPGLRDYSNLDVPTVCGCS